MYWYENAVFYHMFPLGMIGAIKRDIKDEKRDDFKKIERQIPWLKKIGINAVLLGPVFESSSHGYDIKDIRKVDRRLGDENDLKKTIKAFKDNEIRVIVDTVFNHCGREMYQFKDVIEKKQDSKYVNWFQNVDFNCNNHFDDGFCYHGWNGDISLVKYDHKNPEVIDFLYETVRYYVNEFDVDGLRLDAADSIDVDFLKGLRCFCRKLKEDFFLLGEAVHGDHRYLLNDVLDSTTGYECYKGLYSSHNDSNYYEIAYSLKRLFGEEGIYKDKLLYNFLDNHDVNRISSNIKNRSHLYPMHILLFTIPGIPSIYYGSEFSIEGVRTQSDIFLRPEIDPLAMSLVENTNLSELIAKLSEIRKENDELTFGSYKEVFLSHEQFVFERRMDEKIMLIGVNSSQHDKEIEIFIDDINKSCKYLDVLNNKEYHTENSRVVLNIKANNGIILKKMKS